SDASQLMHFRDTSSNGTTFYVFEMFKGLYLLFMDCFYSSTRSTFLTPNLSPLPQLSTHTYTTIFLSACNK
ncbi:1132_t:CDS:2, partial [Gigaspora rosea]